MSRTNAPRGSSVATRLVITGWTETDKGCWEWNGRCNPDGYGWVTAPGSRMVLAHRAAYSEWNGPIPAGRVVVRHTCDNPPCINPAHLVLGTDANNAQDAVSRRRTANGERHADARLTDTQVDEIRARYAAGGITQRALAAEYGVWHQHISSLVNHLKRKSLTNPREGAHV